MCGGRKVDIMCYGGVTCSSNTDTITLWFMEKLISRKQSCLTSQNDCNNHEDNM